MIEDHSPVLIVHAHPDDETLSSGALILSLVDQGVDVYVLTATRGEQGEVASPELSDLSGTPQLADHRERELGRACEMLGVVGHAFLGDIPARASGLTPRRYEDSGMRWLDAEETLAGPGSTAGAEALTNADPGEVAADIAAYGRLVGAEALLTYDDLGGYGHPDHVFLHQPTREAADELDVPCYEIVSGPSGGDVYYAEAPRIAEVLAAYASQLEVSASDVIHVGGQRRPIPTQTVVRRIPLGE